MVNYVWSFFVVTNKNKYIKKVNKVKPLTTTFKILASSSLKFLKVVSPYLYRILI